MKPLTAKQFLEEIIENKNNYYSEEFIKVAKEQLELCNKNLKLLGKITNGNQYE